MSFQTDRTPSAASDPDGPEEFEGTLMDGLENEPPYPSPAYSPEYVARAVSEWTWSGVSRVKPIEGLDPGIAPWVELLRAWRIETHESCQGGPDPGRPDRGHAYAEPTIAFAGGPEAGFRAYAIAVTHALPVRCIRRVWKHSDHELTGPVWEMVFDRQATGSEYGEVMHALAFERGDA